MKLLFQILADSFVQGGIQAMLAAAFGIVYRSARVFHIAMAGLFLIGPYSALVAFSRWHFSMACAVALGTFVGTLGSLLLELVLYRPLNRIGSLSGPTLVASMGAMVVIQNAIGLVYGVDHKAFDRALDSRTSFGVLSLTSVQLLELGVCASSLAALAFAIRKVRVLKALWAMGDEPGLVAAMGLKISLLRTLVFGISGALLSLAACMVALDLGIDPHMGLGYILLAAVAVFVGGVDTFLGWIVAAELISLAQGLVIWRLSSQWVDLVTYAALLILLVVRKRGLLAYRQRIEEQRV